MRRLLFLICCIAGLTAPFCGAQTAQNYTQDDEDGGENSGVYSTSVSQTILSSTDGNVTYATEADEVMTTSILPSKPSTTLSPGTPSKQPSTGPKLTTTTSPSSLLFKMECFPVFLVSGGLIILSFILLVSTLMLAWRVCRQNRRIKELTATESEEYWMETAKKDKNKSETSPNETTVMLADLSETKGEVGNGTAKEEVEDAEKTEENRKEDGDTEKSEEAAAKPEIVSETSPSPKPQEEANETKADSSATSSAAAPSSDDTEEPKEVV